MLGTVACLFTMAAGTKTVLKMEKKRMLLLVVRTTGSYRRTTFFYSCWDYYCSCCLIVFDCRRCRSREPCVSPMTPCIKHYIVRHAIHCIQSPLNNVPPCGRCRCSCEYTLINHPLLPGLGQYPLEPSQCMVQEPWKSTSTLLFHPSTHCPDMHRSHLWYSLGIHSLQSGHLELL